MGRDITVMHSESPEILFIFLEFKGTLHDCISKKDIRNSLTNNSLFMEHVCHTCTHVWRSMMSLHGLSCHVLCLGYMLASSTDSLQGNFTDTAVNARDVILKNLRIHDDVIKWKHFPRYWSFVRGIHRSPMNSPHNDL